ncbi:heterokaryon incompatibility protein-domain-containing protein [Hypoxylon argillaceum]|nr:heterokaryon incompatibility protein-domain-containing protein [Hypoxylon argillaceum]
MATESLLISDFVRSLQQGLQKCNELHDGRCQVTPIADRLPQHIPDWVIDTKEYCIVPGKSVTKYAALSYVWNAPLDVNESPAAPKRLMLQRQNIHDFIRPGFLAPSSKIVAQNPTVVRDSIDLVRRSGMRYLWVDCLCIPQNDDTTGDSVRLIKDIYSGSSVTIIAATTSSSIYTSGTNIQKAADKEVIPDSRSLHRALLASHWATRGWTFQEQLLSKRSFVFLDGTAFWDCEGAVWWYKSLIISQETEPTIPMSPTPFHRDISPLGRKHSSPPCTTTNQPYLLSPNVTAHRKLSQELTTLSTPDFRLYRELICRYNYRNLTNPEDALLAISGVINALARGFPGGFINGLPALFLDSSLIWQPLAKARRRVSSAVDPRLSSPLPSWSWVGWQCRIDPVSLESGLDYELSCPSYYEAFLSKRKRRGAFKPHSRRTRKAVDWSASTSLSDGDLLPEPEILEYYKRSWDDHHDREPPFGWSRRNDIKLEKKMVVIGPKNNIQVCYGKEPSDGYLHKSDSLTSFRYPVPIQNSLPVAEYQMDRPFLSCITTTAKFKIRRVLFPHKRTHVPLIYHGGTLSISALDTKVYESDPDLESCCPVITLVDDQGRWAGLLRVMCDDKSIEGQQTVEVIAISQGSSSYGYPALLRHIPIRVGSKTEAPYDF